MEEGRGDMRIDSLRNGFSGILLQPGDDGFDAARVVWNGMIDRKPAVIARCRNAADVGAAVRFARDNGLCVAIRSGATTWRAMLSARPA